MSYTRFVQQRLLSTLILLFLPLLSSAALDADLLEGLSARAIGPATVGGRIAAIDDVVSAKSR